MKVCRKNTGSIISLPEVVKRVLKFWCILIKNILTVAFVMLTMISKTV